MLRFRFQGNNIVLNVVDINASNWGPSGDATFVSLVATNVREVLARRQPRIGP